MEHAIDIFNFAGLLLLGMGFLWRDRGAHILRMSGWAVVGLYWFSRAPTYLGGEDQFNALGAGLALPIFLYLAFQEYKSYQWDDDYPPLRFVTGAMFIAGMGYFLIQNVPVLSRMMIEIVAHQSVWLANLGGYDFGVGAVGTEGAALTGVPIVIVLECTAIQAYFVTAAFLFGCRGDKMKRMASFCIIAPVVWTVNLFRNAIVIIMVYEQGEGVFDFAHNVLGKGLSLIALILLIIVAFVNVPELYEDINGLFELPWRKGPKHDYLRFVGRLYTEKEEKPGKG